MSSHVVGRRLLRTVPLVGLVLASVGCPEDTARITEQPSAASQEFPITGSFVSPSGTFALNRFRLAVFDTSVANALGTRTPGNRSFYVTPLLFGGGGWDLSALARNSTTDPRLPAIADADAGVSAGAARIVILDPAGVCGAECPFHNPFTNGATLTGLTPSTQYIVALFRYGITINGQLDASLIATGQPLDTPDQLTPVSGTPGGDPNVEIIAFPTIVPLVPDANPMVLGNFTSSATGTGAFDVVVDGTDVLYTDISANPPEAAFDSTLVARDDDVQTTFPRYNYLVIIEGPATDAADAADNPQVLRFQMGQDFLASTGAPVNNGYVPFPAGAFTEGQLVAAPGGAGKTDSMTVTFNANSVELLDTVAHPRRYEAWLVDAGSGAAIPAVGTYRRLQGATVVEEVPGTNTWAGGEAFSHRLILSDAGLGGGAADSLVFYSHVVLTIDDSPGDATMAAVRPFWAWYDNRGDPGTLFDDVFSPQGTTTRFGRLNLANPVASVPFGGQGAGEGSVREGILNIDLAALSRPPLGYVYAAWLLGPDTVQLPDITGPLPQAQSLVDADENTIPGLVTENGILDANFRLDSNAAMIDLSLYGTFRVTLEPKVGASKMSATRTLTGTPP